MHGQRSGHGPDHVARFGTPEHEHQRRLVLELAVAPPEEGDDPADLACALGYTRGEVEAAADVLVAAGLAERRGGRLFASPATMALECLWPLAM